MSDSSQTSGFGQFLAEIRRRHVGRFTLAYAAAAFVVLQLAEIVFPAFGIGEGGLRLLVVVAALGFPPALVLAWVYDLTKEGIKRTDSAQTSPLPQRLAVGALLVATIAVTGGLGLYLARQGVFEEPVGTDAGTGVPVQSVAYDPDAPIRSLAVLPLDDHSPTGDQAYFTASMHEELIAKLSRLEDVRVVSRTTVMQYGETALTMPQIGRQLGVDVVIEGSVARTPERTRVTLQLIHAPSDSHINTLQWEREEVGDVLAFQSEIARDVVEEVMSQYDETTFVQTAGNIAPAAQDAYFRGKYEFDRGTTDGYESALSYFEEAIEEDPDFAAAMAGLAGARFMMAVEGPEMTEVALLQAHREAETALALDSTSFEAMDVLGLIERSMPHLVESEPVIPAPPSQDVGEVIAITSLGDSFEIDISSFDTAWVSAATTLGERIEERVRRRSIFVTRGADAGSTLEARQLMKSGRYAEAAEVLESIVEEVPGAATSWDMLARSHAAMGDVEGAKNVIWAWHSTETLGAPLDEHIGALEAAIETNGDEGYWIWRLERLEELDSLGTRPVPRMELASTHAALGNSDQAFAYLLEALRAGEPGVMTIRSDPLWDEMRSEPRFREIGRQAQLLRFAPVRRPRSGGTRDGNRPPGR